MADRENYLEYLHTYWAQQKAVGMIAEARFLDCLEPTDIEPVSEVMLFQPKPANNEFQPWGNIYTFILDAAEEESLTQGQIEAARLMEDAGTTVIFPSVEGSEQSDLSSFRGGSGDTPIEHELEWKWRSYDVDDRELNQVNIEDETEAWRTRGRTTQDDDDYLDEFTDAVTDFSDDVLKEMFYKEHFFSHHLKETYSFTGTYFDVDGLLVSDSEIVPYEIKEKTAYQDTAELFGLDVSRLIVMMRVALTRGLDPIYIVREVEEADELHVFDRAFVNWQSIHLSDVIRASAWQIQGGGPGMTGGRTQTLMIPKSEFSTVDFETIDLSSHSDFVGNFQSSI
ncbi:hypothetical protein AArcSl_1623 [Halalkaliarchaeum desulfuricum]|uniref:Uncharacterized protein n=1 Tax=Halalkaliarchaeum desulfuricum TaxID=2055893 RepID=A0A343TJI0_9EURY|nr:hypothetical protein [Halalkaliarchaeum desulfuricum]AUX09252.1 hypothetical protein AArcSl_1623 [Halalkaliarchaeum desulfuricum]